MQDITTIILIKFRTYVRNRNEYAFAEKRKLEIVFG